MKKHQKHTKLERPYGGKFHQNEWAIIGAPCPIIKKLVKTVNDQLKDRFKIGFVDEVHHLKENEKPDYPGMLISKISHLDYSITPEESPFSYRTFFRHCDGVMVNGNHFKADKQIVIINDKKKESLSRKIDRLTNIQLVILDHGQKKAHNFLKNIIGKDIPIVPIDSINVITQWISDQIQALAPPIDGLVLIGGKSSRMGEDKTKIQYHDLPQYKHAYLLLENICRKTYLSGNESTEYTDDELVIRDTFTGLGPFGGILSAFRENPNRALLTIPTDTPLIDRELLDFLIAHRNPQKMATCFHNPETGFPEPLITIWEPKAYPILLNYLALGYACPRKALINEDILELVCPNPLKLMNANTQAEKNNFIKLLEK